jgi:hypothetical protein
MLYSSQPFTSKNIPYPKGLAIAKNNKNTLTPPAK